MEVDVPAPAEEAGQLFLISPPRRRPQGVIDLAVEERVCLCLAKFAPRAKLGFGPVTVGKLKTIIVEVSAPAARTATQEVSLILKQQYQKGKNVPAVKSSVGEELLADTIPIPAGCDHVEFHVQYAPTIEDTDGVLGSISIVCNIDGLVLKAELSVSGKAVAPVLSAPKAAKGLSKTLTERSALSSAVRTAQPPVPTSQSGSAKTVLSTPLRKPAVTKPVPTAAALSRPINPNFPIARPVQAAGNAGSAVPVVASDTAHMGPQKETTVMMSTPPPSATPAAQPAAQETMPSMRPKRATGPYMPKSTLSLSGRGIRARPATFRLPASAGSPGSHPSSPTPSTTSQSSKVSTAGTTSSGKGPTPSKSTPPASRTTKGLLQVHTEAPLAKQERALVPWLNSHLAAFGVEFNKLQAEEEAAQTLTLQRLTAQARGILWRQYKKNSAIYDTVCKVNNKIDAGVFHLTEAPLVADVREVQLMLEPLMSYHPFWLRVGLTTVLRDALVNGQGVVSGRAAEERSLRRGLQAVVRESLLLEREVQAASNKQEFWLSARGDILKHFLLLVLIMDATVTDQSVKLPKDIPPLFSIAAKYKSSKEVVRAFLSGRMSGIGDAVHHLELWGYRLHHVQQAADEYDYAVVNLKDDLRNGIRLAKLYQLLTGLPSLLHPSAGKWQLWLNPVCEQQRVENVGKVLDKFAALGVLPPQGQRISTHAGPLPLRARDITEASRELTLGMLWSIALKWQIPHLVDQQALRVEVRRMLRLVAVKTRRPAPEPLDIYPDQRRISLLLKWVQAVCMLHGLRVTNFTSSFGDGRALCYLVSTYMPEWLAVDQIYTPDAPKPEDVAILIEGDEEVDVDTLRSKGWAAVYEAGGGIDDKGMLRSYKEGVKHNYGLVHGVAARLGRVPEMLGAEDFIDGGLEEKAVILYVAHLAARLLEISAEDRAAHIITAALRKHLWAKKYGPELRNNAAVVVQKYWRRYQAMQDLQRWRQERDAASLQLLQEAQSKAATVIQSAWRGYQARCHHGHLARLIVRVLAAHKRLVDARHAARKQRSAVTIQAAWRMHIARCNLDVQLRGFKRLQAIFRMRRARKQYLQLRGAAVFFQRLVREHLKHVSLMREHAAAACIQAHWRGISVRRQHLAHNKAATAIQSSWRGAKARQRLKQQQMAAATIQAVWRGYTDRGRIAQLHAAAAVIQSYQRGHIIRRQFLQLQGATVIFQSAWRSRAVRHQLSAHHAAATTIQAVWRGAEARALVARLAMAATTIQAAYRGHSVRVTLQKQTAAASIIQSVWRGHALRRQLSSQYRAAAVIQASYRGYSQRSAYQKQRTAAVLIQSAWRGVSVRSAMAHQQVCVTTIQAAYRAHVCRAAYHRLRAAATVIQTAWRGAQVRRQLAAQHDAAITIQASFRAYAARKQFWQQRREVIAIQAAWRGHSIRRQLHVSYCSAAIIQAAYRAHVVRQRVRDMHKAATTIQAIWHMHKQQAAYHAQCAAAITFQSAWRGFKARSDQRKAASAATAIQRAWRCRQTQLRFSWARAAAVRVQAAVRAWLAQKRLKEASQAAVCLQSAWRARCARTLLHQHCAARTIQSVVRGHAARMNMEMRHAAATRIQATWRAHRQALVYEDVRAKVVKVQAVFRGWQARNTAEERREAILTFQCLWRRQRAMRVAASLRGLQCARNAAATTIQAWARVWLARRVAAERLGDIVCFQAAVRGHLARRQVAAIRSIREFEETAKAYMQRFKSAGVIQAWWRGHLVRRQYGPTLAAASLSRKQDKAARLIQQAYRSHLAIVTHQRRSQAVATIAASLPMFRARMMVLRARWEAAKQRQAAVVIQSYARMWLARRRVSTVIRNITLVQAVWRAHRVRKSDGRAKAEARKRLAAAADANARNPHRSLGARVRDALEQLSQRKDPVQLFQAVQALEVGTRYSVRCCELIALEGGVAALLRLIRGLNRSKPHVDLLQGVLAVLLHICRHIHLLPAVYQADDCLTVLTERLQFFRDLEEVFMPAGVVVGALVKPDGGALTAARTPDLVRHLEGIAQIIARKMDMERKYISRLEAQKGSDASAKEATRKVLAASKQLDCLQGIIQRINFVADQNGIVVVHHNTVPHALSSSDPSLPAPDTAAVPEHIVPAASSTAQVWQPKNTLVRGVLREVTHNNQMQQAAAAAAAASATAMAGCTSHLGAVKMVASVVKVVDRFKDAPPSTIRATSSSAMRVPPSPAPTLAADPSSRTTRRLVFNNAGTTPGPRAPGTTTLMSSHAPRTAQTPQTARQSRNTG